MVKNLLYTRQIYRLGQNFTPIKLCSVSALTINLHVFYIITESKFTTYMLIMMIWMCLVNALHVANKHSLMPFFINQIVKILMSYEDESAFELFYSEERYAQGKFAK